MDNPFRPTFGASPLVWAGRTTVLADFDRAISGAVGNPDRSIVISGSRGIGKTVLLTELEDIAAQHGWVVLRASAREQIAESLMQSVIPEAIRRLSPPPRRRITGVSVAGIGSVRTDVETTDSVPRLSTQLRELISHLRGTGVLITIDEVQDASPEDLTQVAVTYQDLVRDDLPVAVAMAGLTHGINALLDLPGATFLRRARHYELGPLTLEDARTALADTARDGGRPFEDAERAAQFSKGYPYLVQLLGFLSWEAADALGTDRIDAHSVSDAIPRTLERLGVHVHQPALREVPARQMEYLRAMAAIEADTGSSDVSTAALSEHLGRPSTALSDIRARLIERDLITPAGWGLVEFSQPYLGQYLLDRGRPQRIN
ncbi:AAA family ATPase [uncultured Corynebacterium sp.]|uniref:AAA family ATPase n=1 Tax=uncultured Corynebacterium sp. TaxID=159447 RepID=UPI0025E16C2D|nr:ATP-binding protein [uncultured Corynebacterium sp.]